MADLRESLKNQTSFSLRLTKHVFDDEVRNPNVVFSPLSFHVVLSLIAAGSKGETLTQVLSFLRSRSIEELNSLSSGIVGWVLADGSQVGGPKTSYANSVWIQDYLPLKPAFNQIVETVYRASINKVDFIRKADEIVDEVNSWAEKETMGLIKNVLPRDSVNSFTRLILANALYFKGTWQHTFDAAWTRKYDFHLLDGTSVQTPFMTSTKNQYIGKYDGFKVLRLPYKRYKRGEDKRGFSMYIILSDAKNGLPALIEKLTCEPGFLDRHLLAQYVPVGDFRIPKFKISYGFKASAMLKGMGLVAPFNGGLTEMVDSIESPFLELSEIFHKSFVEVDEKGTEAAAVTFGYAGCSMKREMPIDFVADHPFLFLIREDESGAVLFIGRILDPSLSD